MGAVVAVLYVVLGAFQALAIFVGLSDWLELPWAAALVLAPVAAFTPVVGTLAAVFGAIHGWSLGVAAAVALFVVPLVAVAALYAAVRAGQAGVRQAPAAQRRDAPSA